MVPRGGRLWFVIGDSQQPYDKIPSLSVFWKEAGFPFSMHRFPFQSLIEVPFCPEFESSGIPFGAWNCGEGVAILIILFSLIKCRLI